MCSIVPSCVFFSKNATLCPIFLQSSSACASRATIAPRAPAVASMTPPRPPKTARLRGGSKNRVLASPVRVNRCTLSLGGLVVVDTVLDEADHQRQDAARCAAGQGLDHVDLGGPRLAQRAGAGDHGDREGLQEEAAQKSAGEAGDGVADRAEAVLVGGGRREMAADDAGDDLNYEAGQGPGHFRSSSCQVQLMRAAAP